MNYTNVFGDDTVPPSGNQYRVIPLTGHLQLYWPDNYEGSDFIAKINNVTGNAANWHMSLPSATEVSVGMDFIVRNVGLYAFQVDSASGVPVATLNPGDVKFFYLTDNSTESGIWNVFTYGTGTSASDASQLQGNGLTVVGSKLAAAHPVISTAADLTVGPDDRAKIFAFTGGSNALTLPSVLDLGDNWFIGVRNAGAGSITIGITGIDRIDHQTSLILTPGESTFIFCTGATYYTVGYGRSTQFQFTKLVKDVTAGGTFTLTSGEASNKLLQFVGAPTENVTVVVPAVVSVYYLQGAFTGSANLTIKTESGTGPSIIANERVIVYCDGVNVVAATPVSNVGGGGGTGGGGGVVEPVIENGDGTVTNPSITWTSDTDTGFYRIGENTVGLAAGGTKVASWSPTAQSVLGPFGVGTSSPTQQLDVRGMGMFSGGAGLSGTLPTGTMLQLGAATGQDTRQMIDSYGATTGPFLTFRQARGTASAPTATLTGQNLGQITWRGRGATTWSSDSAWIIGRASEGWTDTAQGSMLLFAVTPNGSTTPVPKLVLDQNGWLTVGSDSNPIAPLDVIGDARIYGGVTARKVNLSRPDGGIVAVIENGALNDHGMIQFRYNNAGVVADSGFICSSNLHPFKVMRSNGTLEVARVDNAGKFEAYSFVQISDERKKRDWEEVDPQLADLLCGVKCGTFTFIETNERSLGVSAQSLQGILPSAVYESGDGLSVSYGNAALVGLIAVAKELRRVKELMGIQ